VAVGPEQRCPRCSSSQSQWFVRPIVVRSSQNGKGGFIRVLDAVGATFGGECVSRDGALHVIIVVNTDANTKMREKCSPYMYPLVLYLLVEKHVSVDSSALIERGRSLQGCRKRHVYISAKDPSGCTPARR
jgi:hypothetical protein